MNDMTPIDAAVPDEATVLFGHQRGVIDMVSATHAGNMRVALIATFLCHSDPEQVDNARTIDAWHAELDTAQRQLERLMAILGGTDPQDVIVPKVCKWVAGHARQNTEVANAVKQAHLLTRDIVKAAQAAKPASLQQALDAHVTFCQSGFQQTIAAFCSTLWVDLERERDQEVTAAKATAETITKTLKRLAHIGKHVRLVALNASVEAARVGDAGRGLGVIAVEFKSLAEEIQHLAVSASADISKLAKDGDAPN